VAQSYQYLGSRGPLTGVADTSGQNLGNWTIAFTPAILATQVPELLIYKIKIQGALGSAFNIYVETVQHDVNIFGAQNTWFDDADSLIVRPGENLYFFYNDPVTDLTPPMATVFLRYDFTKWGWDFTT
jgi:hypothetical protein